MPVDLPGKKVDEWNAYKDEQARRDAEEGHSDREPKERRPNQDPPTRELDHMDVEVAIDQTMPVGRIEPIR